MVREVASLQPRAQGASTLRVALAASEPAWSDEVQRILARRGGICHRIALEEAPEAARDGRDRVWKATSEAGLSISLDAISEADGGKAAVAVFRKQWTAAAHEAVERAEHASRDHAAMVMISDSALRATKAEAREFAGELNDLVEKWRTRSREETDETRTYQILQILQPARAI